MPNTISSGGTPYPQRFEKILELLLTVWADKGIKPLAADELWEVHKEIVESLFHEPPLGPIPEHLKTHTSVHGCVAEYEEKLEELERWKVHRLELWLKDKVGKKFTAGDKIYELSRERGEPSSPDRYWLNLLVDREPEE